MNPYSYLLLSFFRSFGLLEVGFVAVFLLLYLFFTRRTYQLNKRLGRSPLRLSFKGIPRVMYFSLLLFALLGPSFGEQQQEIKAEGKDIFLAVDLSRSMDAVDVQPSRLEKVKFELTRIVEAFSADRIGLIIFTSEAFMQCPLTYDHDALVNLFISPMSTNQIYNKGTDFGPPLNMALEKLLEDEKGAAKQQTSKVIVLVSDGEDFGDETEDIAQQIKDNDIKLFTLGIGTDEGSKIPDGYRYKRDKKGNDVITTLDPKSLKELAQITEGKYFELSEDRNDISRLITTISNIKGELRDVRMMDVSANKYQYFLFIALVLMMLDALLTVKIVKI